VACGRLTIADFQLASLATYWPESEMPLEGFPNVVRWIDALMRRILGRRRQSSSPSAGLARFGRQRNQLQVRCVKRARNSEALTVYRLVTICSSHTVSVLANYFLI
jgi:hypothetical protein